jgi:hypothetical protein
VTDIDPASLIQTVHETVNIFRRQIKVNVIVREIINATAVQAIVGITVRFQKMVH